MTPVQRMREFGNLLGTDVYSKIELSVQWS